MGTTSKLYSLDLCRLDLWVIHLIKNKKAEYYINYFFRPCLKKNNYTRNIQAVKKFYFNF